METTKGLSKKYFVVIVAVVVAIVVVLSRTKPGVIGDLYYDMLDGSVEEGSDGSDGSDLDGSDEEGSDGSDLDGSDEEGESFNHKQLPKRSNCSINDCQPCNHSENPLSCEEVMKMGSTKPVRNTTKFKRRVAIAVDTYNYFYAWYAPITAMIWANMDWIPVVAFVETKSTPPGPLHHFIMKQVEAAGGEVIRLSNNLEESRYLSSMVVSTSRAALAASDWPENDYVLMSDVDIWPLDRQIFDRETSFPASIHVFDRHTIKMYSACYIGMNVRTWREVIGYRKGDDIIQIVASLRDFMTRGSMTKWQQWFVDQKSITRKIHEWHGYPKQVHFYEKRDRSKDRLDRTARQLTEKESLPSKYMDYHGVRPGFTAKNWKHIKALAKHVLTKEQMLFIEDYALKFCHMLSCVNSTDSPSKRLYIPKP